NRPNWKRTIEKCLAMVNVGPAAGRSERKRCPSRPHAKVSAPWPPYNQSVSRGPAWDRRSRDTHVREDKLGRPLRPFLTEQSTRHDGRIIVGSEPTRGIANTPITQHPFSETESHSTAAAGTAFAAGNGRQQRHPLQQADASR